MRGGQFAATPPPEDPPADDEPLRHASVGSAPTVTAPCYTASGERVDFTHDNGIWEVVPYASSGGRMLSAFTVLTVPDSRAVHYQIVRPLVWGGIVAHMLNTHGLKPADAPALLAQLGRAPGDDKGQWLPEPHKDNPLALAHHAAIAEYWTLERRFAVVRSTPPHVCSPNDQMLVDALDLRATTHHERLQYLDDAAGAKPSRLRAGLAFKRMLNDIGRFNNLQDTSKTPTASCTLSEAAALYGIGERFGDATTISRLYDLYVACGMTRDDDVGTTEDGAWQTLVLLSKARSTQHDVLAVSGWLTTSGPHLALSSQHCARRCLNIMCEADGRPEDCSDAASAFMAIWTVCEQSDRSGGRRYYTRLLGDAIRGSIQAIPSSLAAAQRSDRILLALAPFPGSLHVRDHLAAATTAA